MQTTKVAVLGAGSWGTALALALARNKHDVSLWAHRPEHAQQLQEDGQNQRYLAGFAFPDNLKISHDIAELVQQHSHFLLVVPSHAFRQTIHLLKAHGIADNSTIIGASKGFDKGQSEHPLLLSDVVQQELGSSHGYAIVSGPSFSKEVAANLPTAITAAGSSLDVAQCAADLFHGDNMRVYTNSDLIGVQVGGAIKNVMAIAAGISDGLGFGANSRAAIITRGLAEITRLGVAMGAQANSFTGRAGLGDLLLTCTDDQSRNRQFGLGLGKNLSIEQVLKNIGQEVEGYTTTPEVVKLAHHYKVEMPITEQVNQVLHHGVSAQDAVKALLNRNQVDE